MSSINQVIDLVKYKGIMTTSLEKLVMQINPTLTANYDALNYIENLNLRLLDILITKPYPHTAQDIEKRVSEIFPTPCDKWILSEILDKSKKRKIILPVDQIHQLLQKEILKYKIDNSVSLFLVSVIEYVSSDILKLAGNYVRNINQIEITKNDIEIAICADKIYMDLFFNPDDVLCKTPIPQSPTPKLGYKDVVQNLIQEEKKYQEDLQIIIRIFRKELLKIVSPKELDEIFSNILDIYDMSVSLIGLLEDVLEISHDEQPLVGCYFEELSEAAEFDVYIKYAVDITSSSSKDALQKLLLKPEAILLEKVGYGFLEAVKYFLPKLLLSPVCHAFLYFDYIKVLSELSSSNEDKESFQQVQGILKPLLCVLQDVNGLLPKNTLNQLQNRTRRQLAVEKRKFLQDNVENWSKETEHGCNEFICETELFKLSSGKKLTERKIFLFDGLLVLCKGNMKRLPFSYKGQTNFEYKLKEKFCMRKVEIIDRPDTDELKNVIEIQSRVEETVTLIAESSEQKHNFIASLIMINTKSMLDRLLKSVLLEIEKEHPLKLPDPSIYKFSIPDSPSNILLEIREGKSIPVIKGATLHKLIERLTYHKNADPAFLGTFLTTYRSFCLPQDLLQLLIDRFNIPDYNIVYSENINRENYNRYKKEYVQPVQFRVLNVFRHWVDSHFYDFERNEELLENFELFLKSVNVKNIKKWVDSVLKTIRRKKTNKDNQKEITFAFGHSPPPIEFSMAVSETEFNLLTLHPIELARQISLLQFELYKNVKPSELVGSVWTKKDKESTSPNLLKSIKQTTNFTRWLEKSILEAENYEERVAMVTRAIEVMMVFLEYNNLNGVLCVVAAMDSAAINRLKLTFQGISTRHDKFLEECRDLNNAHFKKYQRILRSIDPPCVPFFGMYLTNILHIEEGNPDILPESDLINFSKRQKLAEIIGEIQQFQNQPYCLKVDEKIRQYLENLVPFKDMSESDISDYVYEESLRIEPRGIKTPLKFPRKWPELTLKSPGIKPRRQKSIRLNGVTEDEHPIPDIFIFDKASIQESSDMPHPPPPLPPKSKRIEMNRTSQNMQAPDAPILPPRIYGPPPLPPRSNNQNDFHYNLMPPDTSLIMIRRSLAKI